MFSWAVKNTLLHEYCPNKTCENYRVNLYENWGKEKGKYTIHNKKSKRVYCNICKKKNKKIDTKSSFILGAPVNLEKKNRNHELLKYFMKSICTNVGPRGVINISESHPNVYYSKLANLSAWVRQFSGYNLMKLAHPEHELAKSNINLYSDILELSVRTKNGVILLDYVVTSTTYNDSFFILAATPAFYPDAKGDLKKEIKKKTASHREMPAEYLRDYDYLHAGVIPRFSSENKNSGTPKKGYPLGIGGYFMKKNYVTNAHFLVLKKMLAQVKKITHYFDGESVLRNSAVAAFADRIKENTYDIVVVKTEKSARSKKNRNSDDSSYSRDEEVIAKKYKENIMRAQGIFKDTLTNKEKGIDTPIDVLNIANTEENTLWIKDPHPPIHEQNRRFFWITRRPCNIDDEYALYENAELQPIDMIFASMRKAASFSTRPPVTASKAAKGYDSFAELPQSICDELTINIFYWNFQIRYLGKRDLDIKKGKKQGIRGYDLGISAKKPVTVKDLINWRENVFKAAKEITSWKD